MKISLNWLKDYIDLDMSPDELGHLLTMTGLEVEGIEPAGQSLDGVVVARILDIEPHPKANRLSVCQVDTGKETIQVVCGASNLEVGSLVPFASAGERLPNGTVIKESKLRGVTSRGMLLAEDEMGLTDDHTGIMILPPNLDPGVSLSSSESALDPISLADWVFDLSITPNRPDWASLLGVAREISAITGLSLKMPQMEIEENDTPINELTNVTINDTSGCPRYAAGVIRDVELGPAPFWMRYRLFMSGIRSINNIVDVTNYVLLEMGQPLHAFDYNRLRENRIVVKRAEEGETFMTLDGESRILNSETLMICDGERAVALAGIMGGLNSEIFAGTKDILLESAYFDPVTIRRGAKRLGLLTEASYRFERGTDIEGVTSALKRAMSLITSLAGGRIAADIIDNYPKTYTSPDIHLRVDKTNRILGTELSKSVISGHLKALEMEVRDINENELEVKPPSFRVDITREVDLIEEVARLFGYENVPVTYPSIRPGQISEAPELASRDQIRSIMVGLGFTEIITYSFISPDSADILFAEENSPLRSFVQLLNPLTVDQSVMRTSLIPGILSTVKNNIAHDEKNMKVFEWGKVFFRREGCQQPLEKIYLAAIMTGLHQQETWFDDERYVDFFDIKGALEALLTGLGLEEVIFRKETSSPGYDPELLAGVYCSGSLIGQVGRVSPMVMEAYDLKKENAYIFEVDIGPMLEKVSNTIAFRAFANFPAVYRDISLLVNREIESARIMEIIKQKGGNLLESIQIFDLYEGERLDPSEKALAFRICYRSKVGTLSGGEVNQLHESIINEIRQETGGKLREGQSYQ
ncbi:MAG: phenylalanine--tRNA ligase subunit beta [Deltaproteobacteria bacterium]|nr:phenylalanine--tRNA ligase subunit beta [Deltaproteobacteria bacterium]